MLKNGQRTCPLCRANINDSWLEEQQMVFISDVVDELVDDMWVEFISDDDDEYYRYGSEYYGSEIYSSDYDEMMTVINSNYHDNYLAEVERPIADNDVFELLDLGLQRLFDESNLNNTSDSEERARFLRIMDSERIDDPWSENPRIEPNHDDADDEHDDSSDVDNMIAEVEDAIENAIAQYRIIEPDDFGLERLFQNESELEYARLLRDDDRNRFIEQSVYHATRRMIWYINGRFWFL